MAEKLTVRERVFNKAREYFLKNGFYHFSMDKLAREMHTSKSSIYNHFESKNAIVQELLMQLNTEINTKLEDILEDGQLSFRDKLVRITAFTKQVLEEVSEQFLADLEIHTPDLWEAYQEMRSQRVNKYYKALFEEGIKEGLLRSDISIELILSVYFSLTEIPLKAEYARLIGQPHEWIYDSITEIFLHGVKAGTRWRIKKKDIV